MKKDKNLNLDFFQIARLNYSTSKIIMGGNNDRTGGGNGNVTNTGPINTLVQTINGKSTFKCNPEDGD